MSSAIDPASTEYIVIRPAGDPEASELAGSFREGEWRKRDDLDGQAYVDFEGPHGTLRALPTDQVEVSVAGDYAQVFEVPTD